MALWNSPVLKFDHQRKLVTALALGGGIHEQNLCLTDKANSWCDRVLETYQGGNIIEVEGTRAYEDL
ncbi:MAG: hypothetical protein HC769_11375 [Cyanobacteria bacterium CRU_2_1]|nr:hypothetical protein [Cyanobacteria bacterium RU_5_0]NJR59390.1 hypothetical protein [Cyanobacteria bacterium CRU_2_1]